MADAPVVHIGENSPEHVAYKLLEKVASVEKKVFRTFNLDGDTAADRQWILDTYAECLHAARGYRSFPKGEPRRE